MLINSIVEKIYVNNKVILNILYYKVEIQNLINTKKYEKL